MIILLDTATPLCKLGLVKNDTIQWHEWQADRQLAKELLGYIIQILGDNDAALTDVTGIATNKGPGSFTGLRIGLTVMNTLADSLQVPIVGTTGDTWAQDGTMTLRNGQDDKIVLPDYGADAHITKPRK